MADIMYITVIYEKWGEGAFIRGERLLDTIRYVAIYMKKCFFEWFTNKFTHLHKFSFPLLPQ